MQPEELADCLLFRGLSPELTVQLAPLFGQVTFANGETIFAQGNRAERVYVLEDGVVALQFQPEDGEQLAVATLTEGSVLGWSAVLGRPYYTSSAVCVAETRALAIPGEKLRALIRVEPELSLLLGRMALTVANRQANALSQMVGLINAEITRAAA